MKHHLKDDLNEPQSSLCIELSSLKQNQSTHSNRLDSFLIRQLETLKEGARIEIIVRAP